MHPEYEVSDYRDGSRFIDFAYIRSPYLIGFEVDGYGDHHRHASRRKFGDDRFRQNYLALDRWIIFRFSYDDIRDTPRKCQQFIQQMLGKLYGVSRTSISDLELPANLRELLRWALGHGQEFVFSPKEAARLLKVSQNTIYIYLNQLRTMELIEQASGGQRIRTYRLTEKALKLHM